MEAKEYADITISIDCDGKDESLVQRIRMGSDKKMVMKQKYNILQEKDVRWKSLVSILCAVQVMIAFTLSADQVTKTYHEISRSPVLYFLGVLILFLIFFTVSLFAKRTLLASGIISGAMTLLALVNYYELQLHGTVLTFQDIHNIPTAARVLSNYRIQLNPIVGNIIFSFAVLFLILTFFYSKGLSFKSNGRIGFIPPLILAGLSIVLFFLPFSPIRALDWSWEIRYYVDSVPVGVFENIAKSIKGITKPEGYDAAEIQDIAGIPAKGKGQPDIVVILDETYYDMDHLIDFRADVSYMKNYDALNAFKGYATVPMVGGGTNASEYELLVSNSMTILNTTTPFNDMNLEGCKNVTEYLKKLGYATMAAHSEPAGNYHRGDVWKALGFDETHFNVDFTDLDYYEQRYSASDSSLFENFKRFYEDMPENQPRFAYLLTIQNHGGWDRNSPDKDTVHIQDSKGLSEYEQQINEYLTCIQQTDDFIEEVVDYYSGLDRDVIVYMVGDHGPSLLKEWDIGESDDIYLKKRQVPYFIWSNRGIENFDLPNNKNIDMCALTPFALKAAGLPLSPYYAQLIHLSENVQCITGMIIPGEDNGGVNTYIDAVGQKQDIYGGTEEADLVRKYYYMEYNRLQKKGRLDELYDP